MDFALTFPKDNLIWFCLCLLLFKPIHLVSVLKVLCFWSALHFYLCKYEYEHTRERCWRSAFRWSLHDFVVIQTAKCHNTLCKTRVGLIKTKFLFVLVLNPHVNIPLYIKHPQTCWFSYRKKSQSFSTIMWWNKAIPKQIYLTLNSLEQ